MIEKNKIATKYSKSWGQGNLNKTQQNIAPIRF